MTDYISREAIMSQFADHVKRSNNSDFAQTPTWNEAVQIVEDNPAADVVSRDCYDRLLAENDELRKERPPRHGRWEIGGMFGDIGRCSNCHYMFPADTAMSEFHYCPNCGALMDKDGDGE